jgi:hypothetical protein
MGLARVRLLVMVITATSLTSASTKMRTFWGWPLTTRTSLHTVNAIARRRSCHLVPDASPLAVGEAGYGRISVARCRPRRPRMLPLGSAYHSVVAMAAATACGGAGRAASAQPCSYTMPATPSLRKADAGFGNEGLRRSRHPAPPGLGAGRAPSPVRLCVFLALVSE